MERDDDQEFAWPPGWATYAKTGIAHFYKKASSLSLCGLVTHEQVAFPAEFIPGGTVGPVWKG